jgi:hypothetical protein
VRLWRVLLIYEKLNCHETKCEWIHKLFFIQILIGREGGAKKRFLSWRGTVMTFGKSIQRTAPLCDCCRPHATFLLSSGVILFRIEGRWRSTACEGWGSEGAEEILLCGLSMRVESSFLLLNYFHFLSLKNKSRLMISPCFCKCNFR